MSTELDHGIMELLSESLQLELASAVVGSVIKSSPIFEDSPTEVRGQSSSGTPASVGTIFPDDEKVTLPALQNFESFEFRISFRIN